MHTVSITMTMREWEQMRSAFENRVETRWRRTRKGEITIICDSATRNEIWNICDSQHSKD